MKSVFARAVAVCLIISIFICANIISVSAADSFYQTNKNDVPVWSEASSNSTKVRTITSTGTVVTVTSSTTNSAGNLWYKIGDKEWVFSGNVTEHKHNFNNGKCTSYGCKLNYVLCIANVNNVLYETVKNDVPFRYNPYEMDNIVERKPQGTILTIVMEATNAYNHIWYKANTGLWVYSDNVKKHSHGSALCVNPRNEYKPKNEEKHITISKYDDACTCGIIFKSGIISRESDENHDFKGNNQCTLCGYQKAQTKPDHTTHTIGKQGQSSTSYNQNDNNTHIKVLYNGDNLCSCGQFISRGAETKTPEKHTFDSNLKCTLCGYQRLQTPVTKPSFDNKQATQHEHKASQTRPPSTNYSINNDTTHNKIEYSGDNICSCGEFMYKGKETITKEYHNFSYGVCVVCGYNSVKIESQDTIDENVINERILSNTAYETVFDNVVVRDGYYQTSPKVKTIEKKGTPVIILSIITNSKGNPWGKTEDGFYIYMENLTEVQAVPNLEKCKSTNYYKGDYIITTYEKISDIEYHNKVDKYEKICAECNNPLLSYHDLQSSYLLYQELSYYYETTSEKHVYNTNDACINCNFSTDEYYAKEQALDRVQVGLAVLGLIPKYGEIFDVADLMISSAREDYFGVMLSAVSLLPAIGTASGILKGADKVNDLKILSKGDNAIKAAVNLKPQHLMDELIEKASKDIIKANTDEVIMITKTPDNMLVWLEKGTNEKGLKHILNEHTTQFIKRGIQEDEIIYLLKEAVESNPIEIGRNTKGPYAKYLIKGKEYIVGHGDNGFIISFYPFSD